MFKDEYQVVCNAGAGKSNFLSCKFSVQSNPL